jgi:hypothetical protein
MLSLRSMSLISPSDAGEMLRGLSMTFCVGPSYSAWVLPHELFVGFGFVEVGAFAITFAREAAFGAA